MLHSGSAVPTMRTLWEYLDDGRLAMAPHTAAMVAQLSMCGVLSVAPSPPPIHPPPAIHSASQIGMQSAHSAVAADVHCEEVVMMIRPAIGASLPVRDFPIARLACALLAVVREDQATPAAGTTAIPCFTFF